MERCSTIQDIMNSASFLESCRETFVQTDTDKSGTVEIKELYRLLLIEHRKLLETMPEHLRGRLREPSEADSEALLKEFDLNQDGRLQFEEFVEFCKASYQGLD